MSNDTIKLLIYAVLAILAIIIVAYVIIIKFTDKSDLKYAKTLREGTKNSGATKELFYQKLYMQYMKIPLVISNKIASFTNRYKRISGILNSYSSNYFIHKNKSITYGNINILRIHNDRINYGWNGR